MNNLRAKCLDPRSSDDYVEHLVSADIDGQPHVLHLYATDPQNAISIAMKTPSTSWKLDNRS
jgi:hypothetical protein